MLQELVDKSENQGLKMNKSKTKMVIETDTPIYVNNTQIENVENYIYLGQIYSTRDKKQEKEIQRRITAGGHGQLSPSTAVSSKVTLEHA